MSFSCSTTVTGAHHSLYNDSEGYFALCEGLYIFYVKLHSPVIGPTVEKIQTVLQVLPNIFGKLGVNFVRKLVENAYQMFDRIKVIYKY